MTASILLSTYNGEKYIREQLDSIKNQIVPADEVLIIDDASSDNTVEIIKSYIAENNLPTWCLRVNKTNVGWRKNFFDGFKLCKGEYIFPCDQDDIWDSKKLKEMISIMQKRQQIDLLACEYIPFYEYGENVIHKKKKYKYDGKLYLKEFGPRWIYVNYPGCTYCLRKAFFERIQTTWDAEYAHDAQLFRRALLEGRFAVINMPLIKFRRHPQSATSQTKRIFTKEDRREMLDDIAKMCDKYYKIAPSEEKKEIILKTKEFAKERMDFLTTPTVGRSTRLWLRYHAFYNNIKGWLADNYIELTYSINKLKEG